MGAVILDFGKFRHGERMLGVQAAARDFVTNCRGLAKVCRN